MTFVTIRVAYSFHSIPSTTQSLKLHYDIATGLQRQLYRKLSQLTVGPQVKNRGDLRRVQDYGRRYTALLRRLAVIRSVSAKGL